MLSLTLPLELTAAWLYQQQKPFDWLYHLFVMCEYTLLAFYLSKIIGERHRNYVLASIPLFVITSIIVSVWLYGFKSFPGININIEGMLVFLISILILFNLDFKQYETIQRHPDFWICCGFLVFFGGTFFSNGLYTYLQSLDREASVKLFSLINRPLNIILYTCITIGLTCAIPRRSSSASA